MTADEAIQLGMRHHQAGRLGEAEAIYRQVLLANPRQAEALHLLGTLACQLGKMELAEDLIQQAIAIDPRQSQFYNNLGLALAQQERLDQAIMAYFHGLELRPNDPVLHHNLGRAYMRIGRINQAIHEYALAVRLRPDIDTALQRDFGDALHTAGRIPEAIAAFERGLENVQQHGKCPVRQGPARRSRRDVPPRIGEPPRTIRTVD